MKKKLLLSTFALILLIPTQVFASEKGDYENLNLPAGKVELSTLPADFQETLSKRTKEINSYFVTIEELKIRKESAEEVVKKQSEFGVATTNSLFKLKNFSDELEYYQNNSLEIAGLEKVSNDETSSNELQPLSTRTDANIDKATVYYDNDTQSYVGSANWAWGKVNPDYNNKGRDGVGVYNTQETLSVLETHITTWDSKGARYSPNFSPEALSEGFYLSFDDNSNGDSYTAHRGTAWMFFRFYNSKPVGKNTTWGSIYTHTYSGLFVNGVAVGSGGGLTISFGGSGKEWSTTNTTSIKF